MPIKVKYDPYKGIYQERVKYDDASIDLQSFGIPKNNIINYNPAHNNDNNDGYSVGSRWINCISKEEFVCINNSINNAIWTSTTIKEPFSQHVWIVYSSISSSYYQNNIKFIPLRNNESDNIEFQFISATGGIIETQIYYAMSVPDLGNLRIQFDYLKLNIGSDPTSMPNLGTAFNTIPGNNTLINKIENNTLRFNADIDDLIYCRITRSGSFDTHIGDMRIIEIKVKKV